MYAFGSYPQLLPLIGVTDDVDAVALSQGEIDVAEFILMHGTDARYDELVEGLSKQIDALRDKDSLYSKLGMFGKSKILDELDAVVPELDAQYPQFAPHAAIYGPRFPRDGRDIPVRGRILATTVSADNYKVTDTTGIFGDPYWASVGPEARLDGRLLTVTSGPRKGVSYRITTHVFEGSPYIKVVDAAESINDTNPGDRFSIDGDSIPQDDLGKWDRGRDWMVVSAIRGTLVLAAGAVLRCVPVFNAAGYWLDPDGSLIAGNLAGRDIIIEGVGTRAILSHNPFLGEVTVDDGTGIAGTEAFKIQARSPADTGAQDKGSLVSGDVLEPGCRIRLSPETLASVGEAHATLVRSGMTLVKRYAKLRWHRFRGTAIQLRYLSRNAIDAVEQFEDERLVGDDVREMATELGINIDEPEVDGGPPRSEE